jgi:signal transduction histidine kinase
VMNLRSQTPDLQSFLNETRRLSFAIGKSFPGRVWKSRKPAWLTDLLEDNNFQRREMAAKAGLRTGLAFPVHSGNAFFGVLEFFSTRRFDQNQNLVNMITAVGSEIEQFIKRRSAEEDLRRAHEELEIRVQQRTAALKTANAKLHDAIAERKRLEHELLDITENERRRIGLDLHDDLGQKLSGLAFMTKGLHLKLTKERSDAAEDAERIHAVVQQAMSHARDLARDLATLDPKENDLVAALKNLASQAGEMFEMSCSFKAKGRIPSLEPGVVNQLYKIAQEAVTNAIKHGKARRVGISLSNGSDKVLLKIENTGVPFPDLKSRSTGMGLRIMNYRASLVGGSLEIKRGSCGGTCVSCSVLIGDKSK